MRPHDLLRWLRRRPFRPFRLTISTGAAYDVARPELMLVGNSTLTLELSGPGPLLFDSHRQVEVALSHVVQVAEVAPPAAS